MNRRAKVKPTALGDKLRTFARAYAAAGQDDRAGGLEQAADTVDGELAGTTTGLVDDPIVQALLAAVRAVTAAADRIASVAGRLEHAVGRTTPSSPPAASSPSNGVSQRELLANLGTRGFQRLDGGPPLEFTLQAPERKPTRAPAAAGDLSKGARVVLTAIAEQGSYGTTREQLTVLTGYKRSSRDTYVSQLRQAGHVLEAEGGDRFIASTKGRAALGSDFRPLPKGEQLVAVWRERLSGGELLVFDAVLAHWPLSREQLDERTGYKRSSRDTYLSRLRLRALIVEDNQGCFRPSVHIVPAAAAS